MLAAIVLLGAARAAACGLSPPIGPTGLPAVCHGEPDGWGVRVGVMAGGTSTEIEFEQERASLRQAATTATVELSPSERLGLSAALGASVTGELEFRGETFDLLPGPLGGVGVSYRWFGGSAPFVHTALTLSLSVSTARAADGSETAFTSRDARLGVAVGKTFGRWAAPFVVARAFGAGTDWSVAGGKGADAHLYHVGVGSAFGLSKHVDALAEIAFLGERRASFGFGYLF